MMEILWATLKKKLVQYAKFRTRAPARSSIFEWIEVCYQRERSHSSLAVSCCLIGSLGPEQFEAARRVSSYDYVSTESGEVRIAFRMLAGPAQMGDLMDTGDASVTLRWATQVCLVGCIALCFLGCAPRVVKSPLPLSDSDAAHQDRATITAVSVERVTRTGALACWDSIRLAIEGRQCKCLQCTGAAGFWNLHLTLEISATTLKIVELIARDCWAYLYEESGRFVWITRSNGRDLWLGGAPGLPPGFDIEYRRLKPDEVTMVAPGHYTATIPVTIASHEQPSGELTIAFDPDAFFERVRSSRVCAAIPEGGIYCPAATLMAPAPTQASSPPRAKPQSGAGMGASP